MPEKDQDFTIWAGQDADVEFASVTSIDLTTANRIEFYLHDHTNSQALKLTESNGDITVNSSDKLTVHFNASDTDTLSTIAYRHQLWVEDSTGAFAPISTGQAVVRRGFS